MRKITPGQNARLHALIGELKISKDQKRELVQHYTNNRSESSRDLLMNEANNLIKHLEAYQRTMPHMAPKSEIADIMRKKIIAMLREVGYEVYNSDRGRMVGDMKRIYAFIKERGYLKPKDLNDYSADELPKLVSQITEIHSSIINKLK